MFSEVQGVYDALVYYLFILKVITIMNALYADFGVAFFDTHTSDSFHTKISTVFVMCF